MSLWVLLLNCCRTKKKADNDSVDIRHKRTSIGSKFPSSKRERKQKMMSHDKDGQEEGVGEVDGGNNAAGERVSTIERGEKDDGRTIGTNSGLESAGVVDESSLLPIPKGIRVPSSANLESIMGNACRDILQKNGTQNSRMHGLLIAALSVMTECFFSQEELENLNFGGGMAGAATTSTSQILDLSNTPDPFAPLLQMGALLSALPKAEELIDFTLDEQLLRYFVTASSVYEERIEIQKANLQQSQMPLSPPNDAPNAAQLPSLTNATSVSESDSDNAPEVSDAHEDIVVIPDNINSSEGMPDSISRRSGDLEPSCSPGTREGLIIEADSSKNGDVRENDCRETFQDNNDNSSHGDEDSEENASSEEDDLNVGNESSPESDHGDDAGSYNGADDDENENDDEEREDEMSENENDNDELQRALTLSLVPGNSSDGSHSDVGSSHHSEGSHSGRDASSNSRDAITEAAAGGGEALTTGATISANLETNVTLDHNRAGEVSKGTTRKSSSTREADNSTTLPPLPTPPPRAVLPSYDRFAQILSECLDEEVELSPDQNTSSVFEPSALSSFGKLPVSHVLVHLFLAIQDMMQDHHSCSEVCDDRNLSDNLFPAASFSIPRSVLKHATRNDEGDANNNTKFSPDSTTLSFLIAFLHLSSHLRNSALAVLSHYLSSSDEELNASINFMDGRGIQIAQNSLLDGGETDDSLIEEDDPAVIEVTFIRAALGLDTANDASESFEAKGLKRKAAAAAQNSRLRCETKQNLLNMWTKRAAFYSVCTFLSLRCLRIFMGKSMKYMGTSSSLDKPILSNSETKADERQSHAVVCHISTKIRVTLLSLLSNFYSSEASKSFKSVKLLMATFHKQSDKTTFQSRVDSLQDQLLVSALCNESLCLWGYALPLLYPDHQARVELLCNMLEASQIEGGNDSRDNNTVPNNYIKSCTWSDNEIQFWKIDIMCKRLRVSDMLDCFVAAPIIDSSFSEVRFDKSHEESNLQTSAATTQLSFGKKSLPTISILGKAVTATSYGTWNKNSNNLTKLYIALCQRAISALILWNDLSSSSVDANDHDISGGETSISTVLGDDSGLSRGDIGSLQLNVNPATFHFDSTKCADSISVTSSTSPSIAANQRATKVWGTVLSSTCFLPKSGVHRWAVKLDKCERGHVFVGVSTSRANLKTYVGGDSNGWGLIGTQALWHNRNKLRGNYGSTFRTGAVVVVTLDTNVGTISFGLWKDGSSARGATPALLSSQSLIGSPRRVPLQGPARGGPFIEDWGIAFEGLPLDVKLYPGKEVYITIPFYFEGTTHLILPPSVRYSCWSVSKR